MEDNELSRPVVQNKNGVPLMSNQGIMDEDIYGESDKSANYVDSINAGDEVDNDEDQENDDDLNGDYSYKGTKSINAPSHFLNDVIDKVSS